MADNFKARADNTIQEVLEAGAGVTISARYYVHTTLELFAKMAKDSGATLVLRDTDNLATQELVAIAKTGGKNVIIEIRSSNEEA
jgi:uncharacterized protein YbjQ (UPF0145 family)